MNVFRWKIGKFADRPICGFCFKSHFHRIPRHGARAHSFFSHHWISNWFPSNRATTMASSFPKFHTHSSLWFVCFNRVGWSLLPSLGIVFFLLFLVSLLLLFIFDFVPAILVGRLHRSVAIRQIIRQYRRCYYFFFSSNIIMSCLRVCMACTCACEIPIDVMKLVRFSFVACWFGLANVSDSRLTLFHCGPGVPHTIHTHTRWWRWTALDDCAANAYERGKMCGHTKCIGKEGARQSLWVGNIHRSLLIHLYL